MLSFFFSSLSALLYQMLRESTPVCAFFVLHERSDFWVRLPDTGQGACAINTSAAYIVVAFVYTTILRRFCEPPLIHKKLQDVEISSGVGGSECG